MDCRRTRCFAPLDPLPPFGPVWMLDLFSSTHHLFQAPPPPCPVVAPPAAPRQGSNGMWPHQLPGDPPHPIVCGCGCGCVCAKHFPRKYACGAPGRTGEFFSFPLFLRHSPGQGVWAATANIGEEVEWRASLLYANPLRPPCPWGPENTQKIQRWADARYVCVSLHGSRSSHCEQRGDRPYHKCPCFLFANHWGERCGDHLQCGTLPPPLPSGGVASGVTLGVPPRQR